MKKSELKDIIKEELEFILENKQKIDNVIVSISKTGGRQLELPKGMSGDALAKWLAKNKEILEKEFPIIKK